MTDSVSIAVHYKFQLKCLELPKKVHKRVLQTMEKFRQNPKSPGLNFEKINAACQKNYRSLRVDQTYRCIVLAPEIGNQYLFLTVDHHDDAYAWATRVRTDINAQTNTIQVVDMQESDSQENSIAPTIPVQEFNRSNNPGEIVTPVAADEAPYSLLVSDQLLSIGTPEWMIERVLLLSSKAALEDLADNLPSEVFEALSLYSPGESWSEIESIYGLSSTTSIDVNDFETAVSQPFSKQSFIVIENEKELHDVLGKPIEKWRVFLHPSQRKLVERNWNGPVRVLGGAGTGKTVVAMHRAAWLAKQIWNNQNSTDQCSDVKKMSSPILFLTYNTNLAADIRQNVRTLVSNEEAQLIDIQNIDKWLSKFLKSRNYPYRIVYEAGLQKEAERLLGNKQFRDIGVSCKFLMDEWELVIAPNRVLDWEDYAEVSRSGRGTPLSIAERKLLWPYFEAFYAILNRSKIRSFGMAALDAARLMKNPKSVRQHAHIVVDETQDMGSEALTLIRSIAPKGSNDLFLVGDGHQRIYRSKAVMSHCGIDIKGRGHRLKINYRTTEQIRAYACQLLASSKVDDMDGGEDDHGGYISLTRGTMPQVKGYSNRTDEISALVKTISSIETDSSFSDCCVVLRTKRLRDFYAAALADLGVLIKTLDEGRDDPKLPGVRMATMHRVKGLEFRHVFIAAVCDGVIPYVAENALNDEEYQEEHELIERSLFHVASSRAIETLYVSYSGKPSSFISMQLNI